MGMHEFEGFAGKIVMDKSAHNYEEIDVVYTTSALC